jgi:hypothetical protein
MKLIKLLYAADRESLLRFGKPSIGGHYYAMKLGPVVSEILDLLDHPPDVLGPLAEEWSQHFERIGYDIQMTRPATLDPLSEAEVQLLTDTWDLFARLDHGRPSGADLRPTSGSGGSPSSLDDADGPIAG